MANNDRQVFGYSPQGTPIRGTSPADIGMSSPSAVQPAAQSMPDAMNTPWQTQSPLGGPPPGGGTGGFVNNAGNVGAGGGGNAFGFTNAGMGAALNDPSLAVAAFNRQSGYAPNGGTAALNQRYGNNLDWIYYLLNGSKAIGNNTGEDYLNFANNYLQQGNTAGGAHISTGQVMQALFSNDQRSPIYQAIYGKDSQGNDPTPDQIVNRFIGIMQKGLQGTTPDMVISSMANMYQQAGQEWQLAVSQGRYQGTFTDYLMQQGLDPASLGMG